jgi:hypothetical protein
MWRLISRWFTSPSNSEQKRRKADSLLQISELMNADLSSDQVMKKIVLAAYHLVTAEDIRLYTVDERKMELFCEIR